ncbi:MAG TPA: recombinase family protein [Firmicutes bacterium]|nr:recombinase family protein [Bacillota bacterium]
MIAIVYCRVSTEDQARHGYSLIDQLDVCKRKAQSLGATDIIECVDEGISGSILERPGLTRARDLIRQGHIDLFVCYDPDRLARNLSHQLIVTEEIERAGVRLEFINFDWKDTPEGKLFYSLRGAIAEYEKEKIRERSMRGKRRKALEGKVTHMPGVYGYRYKDSSLEIIPEEAAIVRQIYTWCATEDMGPKSIAARLNDFGIPSPKGSIWQKATVKRILHNRTYIGELILQRWDHRGGKANKFRPPEERVKIKFYPKEHWVTVQVPAIISKDLWNAVQERMERARQLKPGRAIENYLLSGLLRCGICGATMHGFRGTIRQKHRIYYVCTARNPGIPGRPKCVQPYVLRDFLERQVWSRVVLWVQNPDELCAALEEQLRKDSESIDQSELVMIESELNSVTKERSRLVDIFQRGLVPISEIEERLEALKTRENRLLERKSQINSRLAVIRQAPTPQDIRDALREVRASLDNLDFEGRKHLVRMLVDQIVVTPGEITIRARVPIKFLE